MIRWLAEQRRQQHEPESSIGKQMRPEITFHALHAPAQANARAVLTVKIASELGMSEGAIRVAVQRLRRRFIRVLRAEIAKTVASADQVDEEVDHLFKVVGA